MIWTKTCGLFGLNLVLYQWQFPLQEMGQPLQTPLSAKLDNEHLVNLSQKYLTLSSKRSHYG
jgi:hypothetical protein